MAKRTVIDSMPEDKFRLTVSLFLAHSEAVGFLQTVIRASDEVAMARKAFGSAKADRMAGKYLTDLSREASERADKSMEMMQAISSAMGMLSD